MDTSSKKFFGNEHHVLEALKRLRGTSHSGTATGTAAGTGTGTVPVPVAAGLSAAAAAVPASTTTTSPSPDSNTVAESGGLPPAPAPAPAPGVGPAPVPVPMGTDADANANADAGTAGTDTAESTAAPAGAASKARGRRPKSPRDPAAPAAPRPEFPCTHPGCAKMFARKSNRDSHLLSHSSARPHRCELCAAAFARRSDLTRHQKTLHRADGADAPSFLCRGRTANGTDWGCGHRYSRPDGLRKHFNSNTGKKCLLQFSPKGDLAAAMANVKSFGGW